MSYSSGRIFRTIWANVLFAAFVAFPIIVIVRGIELPWKLFIGIEILFVVAAIAMFDLEVLANIGRIIRKVLPGSSNKEISGKTYLKPFSTIEMKRIDKLNKKIKK